MDSSRSGNSIRVGKVRSVRASPKPQRKAAGGRRFDASRHQPAGLKSSKYRTPVDVVGCAKRTFETIPAKKLRIFPPLVSMLRKIYERLETALSVTHVCVKTLKAQADDHDIDVALCLECCVEQVIANEMEYIEIVLKRASS